jgi:hypothetical protein
MPSEWKVFVLLMHQALTLDIKLGGMNHENLYSYILSHHALYNNGVGVHTNDMLVVNNTIVLLFTIVSD